MTVMFGLAGTAILGPQPAGEVVRAYWPVLVIAAGISLMATPVARKLAFRFNVLDLPDGGVKTHREPTACLGGVAILAGLLVAVGFGGWAVTVQGAVGGHWIVLIGVIVGSTFACATGLIDDIKDLKPRYKLIGQAISSLFLMIVGVKPDLSPFFRVIGTHPPVIICDILAYAVVLFFVLGASNSLNLLDGLDGLCAGVTTIITFGFLFLAIFLATWGTKLRIETVTIVIGLALAGSVLGFLVFNRHPAKIFLGDSGSVLLGFVMASMMLLFGAHNIRWWLGSIMIFGLPILDTATALIRRTVNKRPLFVSDRGHIYDQMIDRGIPLRRTVDINYLVATLYVCLGLGCSLFLRTRYAIVVYIIVAAGSFLVVWGKGYFKMAGLHGAAGVERQDPDPQQPDPL